MSTLSAATSDVARPLRDTVLPGAMMIAASFGLARYGYGLLLPEMRADLGFGAGTAGLVSSGTYASYLVANIGVVWVTTRWGPRTAVLLAGVAAALGMALIGTATSTELLAAGVLVSGAAAGLAFPPYADLVAQEVPERQRDVAWSTISSGTGWGVAVAGPIAVAAGEHWRLAWLVFVLVAVLVGAFATLKAPRGRPSSARRPQLSWTWFLCPKSRPLLLSAVLVGAGSAVWWVFSVDALQGAGMAPTPARLVYALCGVAGVLASVSGSVFARLGLRAGYLVACLMLAGSLALLGLARGALVPALLAAVLFGVFYNGVIAAQGIWSTRVFADHPSAGLAATNTALTIGTITGPVVAGVLVSQLGFTAALIGAGAVVLLALLSCPPGARRRRALAKHRCEAAPVRTT